MQRTPLSGAHYLSKGFTLVRQPGIKRFVLIPLLINILLLSIATTYAFNWLDDWYAASSQSDWTIVRWSVENLGWLIWPLLVIGVFVVVFFAFAFLANWIAAPFNGLLSEAVERKLVGKTYTEDVFNWQSFFKDIPRLMGREWRKLRYYLPRALGCLLLFFVIGPLAPIIWFLFNAWMTGIQYIDYPMDNRRAAFSETLALVNQKRSGPFGFGALVMLFTMIPVINILIMPVAVAGATALWFDRYSASNEV